MEPVSMRGHPVKSAIPSVEGAGKDKIEELKSVLAGCQIVAGFADLSENVALDWIAVGYVWLFPEQPADSSTLA